jgi:F-type H+-transporting ATPase subunit gamma
MEMIAAFRMRQAQARVIAARPYAERIEGVIARLVAQRSAQAATHPLLAPREEIRRIGLVHITPDRGLCGGLDINVNRFAGDFILRQKRDASVTCVGRKGRDFMVRSGQNVEAIFTDMGDGPTVMDILPVARQVMSAYESGDVDEVYVSYARFGSVAVQTPTARKLLPIEPAELSASERLGYIYEPSAKDVLDALLPRFVEREIYEALLEAVASEQSARFIAMRNATDNANDMMEELTLLMNKIRQQSITEELLDIVGAVEAL